MGKRKYLFCDRATAEEAFRQQGAEMHGQLRLARALYSGRIQWGECRGSYRFGLFDLDSCSGPQVVEVFHPIATGQEPDLRVFDFEGPELRELERMAVRMNDNEGRDILDCVLEIRAMYRQHDRSRVA